ncbi:tetratricopeptide repeat protein [Nonomuraea angiospora]|uniref:Tetratricopeptide (TPR) repeat protein n=1 Tax=Nonomuraea angiospora TaxID=46172 RepID=A0ABR9M1A8_9ACTN|nr:tetratricopeptide repeat protein [Nonomuraea angiospora]MBE1586673.1 tetratricopeptide (TPR) repeat protein [Nonomuraea angiospora]
MDRGIERRKAGEFRFAEMALTTALTLYKEARDPRGEADVLVELSQVQYAMGASSAAAAHLSSAIVLYRSLGDRLGEARALDSLGTVRHLTGDCTAALESFAAARALFERERDRPGMARATKNLGFAHYLSGDFPPAHEHLSAALVLFTELGDRLGTANALKNLGVVQQLTGDLDGAYGTLTEALSVYRELGSRMGVVNALTCLTVVQYRTGDLVAARSSPQEALEMPYPVGEADALRELGFVAHLGGDPEGVSSCWSRRSSCSRRQGTGWGRSRRSTGSARCCSTAGTRRGRRSPPFMRHANWPRRLAASMRGHVRPKASPVARKYQDLDRYEDLTDSREGNRRFTHFEEKGRLRNEENRHP